jgi:transcriptional regulator with XRE-family HTH domain
MTAATSTVRPEESGVGPLLRGWRQRRRLSQLEFSLLAGVSTRHLSYVETGRSVPSREMVLHLTERLEVPLRERNRLLLAAGYAPVFGESELGSPRLAAIGEAVRLVLDGHEPYPAAVLDRWWNLVDGNSGIALLTEGVAADLLEPPVNVLRVSLHPDGIAPRIVNLGQWRAHLLDRLRRQAEVTADPQLAELHDELAGYPGDDGSRAADPRDALVVPLRVRHGDGELAFVSMTTTFGTPLDVTVAELVIESFFPADAATAAALRR